MPFAIGLYLPIYLNASIMIGGVVRMFMDRRKNVDEETKTKQTTDGTLYCAGMIAGRRTCRNPACNLRSIWN